MANYILKDVDDEQWKVFKASCDLQGITVREFFINCIDTAVKIFRQEMNYHKGNGATTETGSKNT